MFIVSPQEFFNSLGCAAEPRDHHWTGPPHARQDPNNGSVFHEEGRLLFALAWKLGGPVLEIGADLGISTRYIHEGLERGGWKGPIYSVDIYHKWLHDPDWPLRERIDADSTTYVAPQQCAWSWVDGDHRAEGVAKDIETCRRNGIKRILFHDTSETMPAATGPSAGSDARSVVTELLKGWELVDIASHCGMIWADER